MKNNIYTYLLAVSILVLYSCNNQKNDSTKSEESRTSLDFSANSNRLTYLLKSLKNPTDKNILVVSHRGDWRKAPENSLEAIQSCIDMGVDMVEVDVRKTKDGHLILMHDTSLDRTTNGKGLIKDHTLAEIRELNLKSGIGVTTKYKIPTLKEALKVVKGKILINLDKCYDYFMDVYPLAIKTGTENQIVMKGYGKTVDQVIADFGTKLDTITFMPIINLDKQKDAQKIINDFQERLNVKALEIVFSTEKSTILNQFSEIKNKGSRVWVNSLWSSLNSGYEDNAALINIDSIYGWYVDKGINMIQTDRPQLLLDYLRSKNMHN